MKSAPGDSENLGQRSLAAVLWSGADMVTTQGLRLAVTVLLARLLAPEDFGAVAMLYLFVELAALFIDGGFGSALIQKQKTTRLEESAVFYFNLVAGGVAAAVLVAASPALASFFNIPVLQPLACLMAANLFLGAFGSIHRILLTQALDFRTQMKASAAASVLSGAIAVFLAWRGFGVWSLAAQTVASTATSVVLLWLWHPWRPLLRFDWKSLRPLFAFGSYMFLSGLMDTFHGRLHTLIIGRIYTARDLAFFSRAETTQQIPSDILSHVLGRVAFPVFSAAAHNRSLLAAGVRRSLTTLMMLNIPAMVGLAVVADPLVRTVFGEKWAPSVPLLQILCFSGLLWPIHVINLNVLKAQGRSDLFFRIEVAKTVIGIVALALASLHSVRAIAFGYVAVSLVSAVLNAFYTGVFLGYGPLRQAVDVAPYGAICLVMTACVYPISFTTTMSPAVLLLVQVVTGAVVYLAACKLLKLAAFEGAWRVLWQQLRLLGKTRMAAV